MKKTPNNQQRNLIEPPVVIDLRKLLTESKLSENEQGILKRRLLENREPFGKMLQLLARRVKQETGILDIPESLKQLEEKEGREIRNFDSIAKVLSRDFPQLLQFPKNGN
jgi:formate dehydrogenase maturation protein FdhE